MLSHFAAQASSLEAITAGAAWVTSNTSRGSIKGGGERQVAPPFSCKRRRHQGPTIVVMASFCFPFRPAPLCSRPLASFLPYCQAPASAMTASWMPVPTPTPLRSVYTPSPFRRLPFHWWECGQGPDTLVFLHGIMAHAMAFRLAIAPAAEHFRVIVVDLPAHGRDQTYQAPEIAPTLDTLSDWLLALFEAIDAPRIHLVGHSLGATLSFLHARHTPERRLQSVSLVSPGLKLRPSPRTAPLINALPTSLARLGMNRLGIRLLEPMQWRRARMSPTELDAYLSPLKEPARLEFMLKLASDLVAAGDRSAGGHTIDLPTLLLWGDRDHLLPLDTAHRLQRDIPDARLHIFKGCGHSPMEDAPLEFNRALHDFLIP
ncbi:alpha/beta hydrolase [Lujinxingia sediminis]|uniref:Alpha/beta hydrolase n=2 Tax=Lujinxingia sediminis TaxID=2480984 RepID=A0ABY0CVV9_9DELT|nr:alpha/beta hydrolase [Lujinxingia sediminis]